MSFSSWPPPFTFRRSQRAKRLALRLDPMRGLEIVLPNRASEKQGLAFLQSQKAWVERHLPSLSLPNQTDCSELPDHIPLACIDQVIPIEYVAIKTARRVTLSCRDDRLFFYGDVSHFSPCVPLITNWLKAQAKRHLPDLLTQVSKDCDLHYQKVSVRAQKTLWGSCTSDKSIQLNYKLLLLPAELARYVMIHELCHTVHLNHSAAFWNLVDRHMPSYKKHEKTLKKANDLLPRWLF